MPKAWVTNARLVRAREWACVGETAGGPPKMIRSRWLRRAALLCGGRGGPVGAKTSPSNGRKCDQLERAARHSRFSQMSESAPCRPQTASRRDEAAPRGRAARRQRVPPPPRGGCRVREGQTRRTRVLRRAGRRAHHSSALRWRRRRRRGSRRAGVARGVQPRHAGVRVPRGPVEGGDADCQGRGLQVHGRDVEGHVQVYTRRRRWRPGFT